MYKNIVWGIGLILFGASLILHRVYAIDIPFEVVVGLIFIGLGLNLIFQRSNRIEHR